jgi:hypothetical protein
MEHQERVDRMYQDLIFYLRDAHFLGKPLDTDNPKEVAVALGYLVSHWDIQQLVPEMCDDRR